MKFIQNRLAQLQALLIAFLIRQIHDLALHVIQLLAVLQTNFGSHVLVFRLCRQGLDGIGKSPARMRKTQDQLDVGDPVIPSIGVDL